VKDSDIGIQGDEGTVFLYTGNKFLILGNYLVLYYKREDIFLLEIELLYCNTVIATTI
jgi:hypothetical protein